MKTEPHGVAAPKQYPKTAAAAKRGPAARRKDGTAIEFIYCNTESRHGAASTVQYPKEAAKTGLQRAIGPATK